MFNEYPYTNFHELNLDWILKKIKEFENRINSFEENVLKKANEYTDEKLLLFSDKITNDFITFTNEVTEKLLEIDSNYEKFVTYINARINLMENEIIIMNNYISTILKQANDYTQNAIKNNNEYIISETTKALSTVTVINYFTGNRVSIQEMFDYLCGFHLENSITYLVMTSREKTYNQFNELNISYSDLALNGGSLYV